MKRTKPSGKKLAAYTQIMSEILSRGGLARRLGHQYGDKRKVYEALGYPDENRLTFEYYYDKYDRQEFARAVIDRPCDATWRGGLVIKGVGESVKDSSLNQAWRKLNEKLTLKQRLNKVDKLCDLGRYSLLFLGLDDVKDKKDFQRPVSGKRKLLYVKQIAESEGTVYKWEKNINNPRYGLPVFYQLKSSSVQTTGGGTSTIVETEDIIVHHSRIIHYVSGNLTSEVFGVSKLKPIINRLVDLEKLLGGDAEMFWRGARPGYTATAKPDYELGEEEEADLLEELDKYEHDLRRFITVKGVDIEALEQQLSDPIHHIDVQLQAISAETGIPKRILIGSERGELASSQDRDQWKELVLNRRTEYAEPNVLRPFIDRLMMYQILPSPAQGYEIIWDDIFAPSEGDKADIGKKRADALRAYAESPLTIAYFPPEVAFKYLLGLNEEQVQEAIDAMNAQRILEENLMAKLEQEEPDPDKKPEPEEEKEEDVSS